MTKPEVMKLYKETTEKDRYYPVPLDEFIEKFPKFKDSYTGSYVSKTGKKYLFTPERAFAVEYLHGNNNRTSKGTATVSNKSGNESGGRGDKHTGRGIRANKSGDAKGDTDDK